MALLERVSNPCLLRPGDIPPSDERLRVAGVFNPGAAEVDGEVLLLARVAESVRETRPGWRGLPRFAPGEGLVIDWVREDDVIELDPRVVQRKADGLVRLTFISHLRVVYCGDGRAVRSVDGPVFAPEAPWEAFGVEDPRITPIGDAWRIAYVAVSPHGVCAALASTRDFRSFERHGVILPVENKDVALFPERIGGEYWCFHRPVCAMPFARPEMWLARSPDLLHWGGHQPFSPGPAGRWETGRMGASVPPFATPEGWLEIYHGNIREEGDGAAVGAYSAGAFLLDRDNPARMLARTPEPILLPEAAFEREGFLPNVVFPTGAVQRDGTLLVYYGAADACVGMVEWRMADLMNALRPV